MPHDLTELPLDARVEHSLRNAILQVASVEDRSELVPVEHIGLGLFRVAGNELARIVARRPPTGIYTHRLHWYVPAQPQPTVSSGRVISDGNLRLHPSTARRHFDGIRQASI